MRSFVIILSIAIFSFPAFSQDMKKLKTYAYNWNDLPVKKTNSGEKRQIFEGYTNTLSYFEVHVTTLNPGKAPHGSHVHTDMEELIIVKEGTVEQSINGTI